jgi:plastocyanin
MKWLIGSKSRLLISTGFLIAILSILNSCSKTTAYDTPGPNPSPSSGPGTDTIIGPGANEVWIQGMPIQGMAFNPATITVAAGTTITWTNKDPVAHTVTSGTVNLFLDNLFDSGTINPNGTYSLIFATAGTFPYSDSIYPGMKATVIVN